MATVAEGTPTVVSLTLKQDHYQVVIGSGLLETCGTLIRRHIASDLKKAVLVTDSNVGPLYAKGVIESCRAEGIETLLIEVPAGEVSKNMEQVTEVCRQMLRSGLDRKSFLIALGGGVIGDLAGFCAAIFQRGIPCIQIPTTIVSQVDSSVGGKTGVNTPEGKNLLGSFHQPELVIADVATLESLPPREYNEGFAEIIKHAAIRDASLLDLLEGELSSRKSRIELITRNVAIKADVVEEDERETKGVRALLNFGHTLGHGIEAAGGYGRFLHGEAISLGLVAATRLSVEHASLPLQEADRIISCLKGYQLPVELDDDIADAEILKAMKRDKKFESGAIRFVLLKATGHAFVSEKITQDHLESSLKALRVDAK
ncbi:MAG: 3-dehydroquinate synthase [Verrucomicrobiota bacterium]